MPVPTEAVKVKKRRERACLVEVCCHRGPGSAESEWVGPLGSPDYPEKTRGSRRQAPRLREGAWPQRRWRAPPPWRPGEPLKGPRWGRAGECLHPPRRNGTFWLWSWWWDSCRSAAPLEWRRLKMRASSRWRELVPAGGTLATQELASGGRKLMTGIVLERRGGSWDAEEGGASEGTRLREEERIK